MAAVAHRLREDLSRRRAAGIPFDAAWPPAMRAAAHAPGWDVNWAAALHGTRDAWRAAYDGTPATSHQRACLAIASDPDREPLPDTIAA